MKVIQVEKVKNKSELMNFILFSWKVYKGDPNWIPPRFWKRERLTFRKVKGR